MPSYGNFYSYDIINYKREKREYNMIEDIGRKIKELRNSQNLTLKELSEKELIQHFGKVGRFYYQIVRGIDNRAVVPNQETKSIGAEDTFQEDLTTIDQWNTELDAIALVVYKRLSKHQLKGRTITVKIKYSDFKIITRSQSFEEPIDDLATISNTAKELLLRTETENSKIRLLGISISNFGEKIIGRKYIPGQLPLFDEE